MKSIYKGTAINLRKRGKSYSEILGEVPVAKSTLSLWLRTVGLSKRQKQRLKAKRLDSAKRGAAKKRELRTRLINKIQEETKKDVRELNSHDLWLAGIMLYWAEGSKEKSHNIGQQTLFSNSDYKMIKVFLKWLREIIKIPDEDLNFEIYIHKNGDVPKAINWWSKVVSCDKNRFKVYFKKHRIKKTNRKNVGVDYNGLLRIRVRRSSILNRKISAWIEHLCIYWEVV